MGERGRGGPSATAGGAIVARPRGVRASDRPSGRGFSFPFLRLRRGDGARACGAFQKAASLGRVCEQGEGQRMTRSHVHNHMVTSASVRSSVRDRTLELGAIGERTGESTVHTRVRSLEYVWQFSCALRGSAMALAHSIELLLSHRVNQGSRRDLGRIQKHAGCFLI